MVECLQQNGVILVVDCFLELVQVGIKDVMFVELLVVQGGVQEGVELQGLVLGLGGQGWDVMIGGLLLGKSSQLMVGVGLLVNFLYDVLLLEIGMCLLLFFFVV